MVEYINRSILSPWYDYSHVPNFPKISKPQIIGYFSIDGDRNYHNTAENIKYLKLPKNDEFLFDLNKGYDKVIHKPESCADEKIDQMLKFILANKNILYSTKTAAEAASHKMKPQAESSNNSLNCDFICFRGLLRLLMCTPYEHQEDWCILVTKFKGTIYLCQEETEQKKQRHLQETEKDKRFCSYGFKFEQYILTDDPKKEPNTDEPVNEAEEFCCMFKTTLQGLKLLYGAEMDGIVSSEKVDLSTMNPNEFEFIEVKVTANQIHPKQERSFVRFKLRNWWCQSFLVGIQNLYIGFRDDKGLVDKIDKIEMKSIPKKSSGHWHPNVCMDFLVKFLNVVKNTVNVDCPQSVYKFYWHPKKQKFISFRMYNGKNEFTFLPNWYIDEL